MDAKGFQHWENIGLSYREPTLDREDLQPRQEESGERYYKCCKEEKSQRTWCGVSGFAPTEVYNCSYGVGFSKGKGFLS